MRTWLCSREQYRRRDAWPKGCTAVPMRLQYVMSRGIIGEVPLDLHRDTPVPRLHGTVVAEGYYATAALRAVARGDPIEELHLHSFWYHDQDYQQLPYGLNARLTIHCSVHDPVAMQVQMERVRRHFMVEPRVVVTDYQGPRLGC